MSRPGTPNRRDKPERLSNMQVTFRLALHITSSLVWAHLFLTKPPTMQRPHHLRLIRPDHPPIPDRGPLRPRRGPLPRFAEHRVPVLSIASQSLSSLTAALAVPSLSPSGTSTAPPPPPIPLAHMMNRVRAFVTGTLGFDHVFDTTFAPEIVLREHTLASFLSGRRGRPVLAVAVAGHYPCSRVRVPAG